MKKVLIILIILFLGFHFRDYIKEVKVKILGYNIVKIENLKSYPGIGQQKVKNQDGYFTTFTTVKENEKNYKEYKQNGDASWSKNTYWGGTMADNGCGITAMSIILSGYKKDYTPEYFRNKYYPVLDYEKMPSELASTFGIANSGFYFDKDHLSNKSLVDHLKTNRPIIICVSNSPTDNRWTTASHYMALLATDGDDKVYVSNPSGGKNDIKSSGWYNINEVRPYIAKAIYIERYE